MPPTAKKPTRLRQSDRHAISGQLKDIIASRGLTAYAIGKQADVDPCVVQRFITGERDIRMETADRIAAALGVRLVEVGRPRGRVAPSPVRSVGRVAAAPRVASQVDDLADENDATIGPDEGPTKSP
jgi:transcriptional regulator with XRE-family HTH domain